MAEKRTTGQETSNRPSTKEVLQQLHDQGVIDLDAPMRQIFDKIEAGGDVSGYQKTIEGPEGEQIWALYRSTGAVFALTGEGLKDDSLR